MEFEVNNKVDVLTVENEQIGSSLLQDYDEHHLYISAPINKGILRRLEVGMRIKLIYYEENRLYAFEGQIDDSKRDNILLYRVPRPKDFEIVQRRKDIRFPIVLDVRYIKISLIELADFNFMVMDEIEERFEHAFTKCLSVDLSGQGIGLVLEENLQPGEHILVLIEHPLLKAALKGKVIRKEEVFRDKDLRYRVGVRFFDLTYNTKEKIVSFIFEKMREHLKSRKE